MDRDAIKLNSGRQIYANCGIIGIAETDGGFSLSHGYDGGINWPPYDGLDDPESDDLTADDMRDLADLLIDRWTRFRASLPAS